VGEAVRVLAAVAEDEVHGTRFSALNLRKEIRVKAKLDEELRLRGARELGVDGLVAPAPERGGRLDSAQEVGAAKKGTRPRRRHESRLEDDVVALAHRALGEGGEVGGLAVGGDLEDSRFFLFLLF